ncbi:unnamed protein product [Clavelina lepadiformis]|uniref:Uncharacterized protein n=1 Tax=Clavelina lepadiformis TaxID=159417 RepID=A0ABP0F9P8_CLALP
MTSNSQSEEDLHQHEAFTSFYDDMIKKINLNKKISSEYSLKVSRNEFHSCSNNEKHVNACCKTMLDCVRLNNILVQAHKQSTVKLHNPKKCQKCDKHEGKIIEKHFLRKKVNLLEERIMPIKIDKHLLKHNSITLIGDIALDLPKPCQAKEDIWQRFMCTTSK